MVCLGTIMRQASTVILWRGLFGHQYPFCGISISLSMLMRMQQPGACTGVPISRGNCWKSFSCGGYSLGFALVEDALDVLVRRTCMVCQVWLFVISCTHMFVLWPFDSSCLCFIIRLLILIGLPCIHTLLINIFISLIPYPICMHCSLVNNLLGTCSSWLIPIYLTFLQMMR